ncbi:preprotein translocase subunit SecG [Candidatus Saccharibacteria bacterium RIFCSPHIGHO2_12_FULL_41_12]|nr:MAG: preprotein translocase subunit SecG [Candidatus Saccharibacteria bacterium RIFCSPHIGHO2_12_FULL_41_12]
MNIFGYIAIVSMVLMTILILMQTRGAGLGAGLGGGGEVNTVRRGSDKSIHQITIILVIIFCVSLLLGILV